MKSAENEMLVFCRNVKTLRKRYALSKKSLAEIMGIGVGSITNIENGYVPNRLGVTAFLKLATYLNIKPHEFFIAIPDENKD